MDHQHQQQSPSQDNSHSASISDENTPLLPTSSSAADQRPKSSRTVTFSANPVTRTIEPAHYKGPFRTHAHGAGSSSSGGGGIGAAPGPPALTALNSKLRRRNSHGAVGTISAPPLGPKMGPQRSTKKTEKLKLLPNPELDEEEPDEESGRDVYSQYTRIKDPTARRDAARLGKADRDRLPRVTAYCTANRYEMEGLMRFLKGRGRTRGSNPKLIDECIYTPYNYIKGPQRSRSEPAPHHDLQRDETLVGDAFAEDQRHKAMHDRNPEDAMSPEGYQRRDETAPDHITSEELLGPSVVEDSRIEESIPDFDTVVHTPETFLFNYGVVVIWGMTEAQETKFLKEISKFELEKLAPDDVETEHFNFYYTREYQARIYNDFITLRDKNNYMTKLAISHALAQSVKVKTLLTESAVHPC